MILLITGGRSFTNLALFTRTLNRLYLDQSFAAIIHGACPTGADAMVKKWVEGRTNTKGFGVVVVREYPADWAQHGKSAGPRRNQRMLDDGKPDLVLAFDGNAGTADMVKRAQRAGIEVLKVTA